MKSFTQYLKERIGTPYVHEGAMVMRLRDLIDTLAVLDAKKTDVDRLVEIREDVPEPGSFAVRLWAGQED